MMLEAREEHGTSKPFLKEYNWKWIKRCEFFELPSKIRTEKYVWLCVFSP